VRHRGGRFEARVQIAGTRHAASFEREADAWAWIETVKADAVRGVLRVEKPAPRVRFEDLCRLYRVTKAPRWRDGTARFFDAHVRGTLLPRFGRRLISEISTQDVQRFLDHRLTEVSAMTVSKAQQLLGQLFNYAVRMGYLPRTPMLGVERARAESPIPRVFKIHELQAILAACPARQRPFFTVLALTGLRRSEIFRMRWDWIDFDAGWINVKEAKRGSNGMPLSTRVRAALLEVGPHPGGRVFPGRSRNRSEPERMLVSKRTALARVLAAASVDPAGAGLHTFRHTFISLLERIPGVSYSIVKALARHSMGSGARDITARYLHPEQGELRQALELLEARVFPPSNVVLFPQRAAAGQP
jgi:integrase